MCLRPSPNLLPHPCSYKRGKYQAVEKPRRELWRQSSGGRVKGAKSPLRVQSTRIFKLLLKFKNTHSVAKRLFRHAEIHTVFPPFYNFRMRQNLWPNALAKLCGAALKKSLLFSRACDIIPGSVKWTVLCHCRCLRHCGVSCGYERLNNLGGQDNGFDEGIDQPVHEG